MRTKAKGLTILVLLWLAALGIYFVIHQNNRARTSRIISALQAFSRDYLKGESNRPVRISIHDLVIGGYLGTQETTALAAVELVFSNFTAAPMTLREAANCVVLRAQLRDGKGIEVFMDGSAHLEPPGQR